MGASMVDMSPDGMAAYERGRELVIKRARRDPVELFRRIIVDPEAPDTKLTIQAAAHQVVAFRFAAAHPKAVFRWPTDTGKSFFNLGLALYELGRHPNLSVMFAGKTQEVAKKPQRMLRSYLENPDLNIRVRSIFPHLVLSDDPNIAQTETSCTIRRASGGADASAMAIGLDTAVQGKKFGLILADDLLDADNTATPEQRKKLRREVFARIFSRRTANNPRVYLTNVPWDEKDLTFELEEEGWPTLHMDLLGNIRITNTKWYDRDLLIPSSLKSEEGWFRLRAHHPDPDEEIPLMPDRYSPEKIEQLKKDEPASEFSRSRMCKPLASDEQRCREEWIHGGKIEDPNTHEVKIYPGCKVRDTAPLTRIAVEQRGRLPIFVGVDLAWGNSKKSDRSAFFALGVGARGARIVLNIESAKGMTGPQIVRKLFDWHERYDPFLIQVESVAAQKFIVDFAREIGEDAEHRLRNIRVRGYVTKKIDKFSSEVGIEQLFTEFERGLWKIPANSEGRCVKEIQEWIDEMTGWRPGAHAGDRLMAGWFAWKAAYRRLLAAAPRSPKAKNERNPDELAKDLRTRRPNWRGRDGANTLTDWTKGTY